MSLSAPSSGSPDAPTALITGAAAGIGRATALRLASAGWRCVLVDADAAAMQRLAAAWPPTVPEPLCQVADLTDATQIEALGQALPSLDALINNAGLSAGGAEATSGGDDGSAARLLALNLAAPARMVQACSPWLRRGARIVNLASGAGLRAIPWRGLYSPSKAGLIAQTRALAKARPEWTVTALAPGFVRTELVQRLIDDGRLDPAQAVSKVPMGRMAEPEEIAEALCFLVSLGARALTGQLLVLDGGSSVCGGSTPLPPSAHSPLRFDAPLRPSVEAMAVPSWRQALDAWTRSHASHVDAEFDGYPAVIDGSVLDASPGTQLEAVLEVARRFRARHAALASLTLLLPAPEANTSWELVGDAEAVRMLVATLAAEWGARGLRINALVLASELAAEGCLPVLEYLSGPRAQFLTGQVLQPGL
ncbi:SDR family NAD(P)-dependent oxidoreductase [Variovorax ginsengisoli]|uniref:NAD(P)-dependent dehydrogenase (Short-subunit alcohol dehydrogenase family) n=1 Tax=Variovorax ginsengisoli TaxID=363844 RepID=A0ABT9SFZ1_9BURK|nr:SDR family oxidoreductase [Variovorax ginsengisoli]MDP9902824.1 NAD(P)-dependent dehydrogenase (short-subunit alcohol dehydrogenase family) [Variovorax ginsengisoli]